MYAQILSIALLKREAIIYYVSNLIYPPELTLSRTDKDGIQADYLDLDITISANGLFITIVTYL